MSEGAVALDSTPRELLSERRLRGSELALQRARGRLAEVGDELVSARTRVSELEDELMATAAAAEAEPALLRAQLAMEVRARRAAEQLAHASKLRADELSQQLARATELASGVETMDDPDRELALAQRTIRQLEGELELVRRRAAEFEQMVRIAVDSFWRDLHRAQDRQSQAFGELASIRRLLVGLGHGRAGAVPVPVTRPPVAGAAPDASPLRAPRSPRAPAGPGEPRRASGGLAPAADPGGAGADPSGRAHGAKGAPPRAAGAAATAAEAAARAVGAAPRPAGAGVGQLRSPGAGTAQQRPSGTSAGPQRPPGAVPRTGPGALRPAGAPPLTGPTPLRPAGARSAARLPATPLADAPTTGLGPAGLRPGVTPARAAASPPSAPGAEAAGADLGSAATDAAVLDELRLEVARLEAAQDRLRAQAAPDGERRSLIARVRAWFRG